jgi:transmembrane sensor
MSTDAPSVKAIREQAAHWVVQLNDRDLNDAEREAFHQWLLLGPRHTEEFRAHTAIVALARELPHGTADDDAKPHRRAIQWVKSSSPGALAIPSARRPTQRQPRGLGLPGLVAAALLALAPTGWFAAGFMGLLPTSYTSGTGEVRTVILEDGSVVYLNTRTRLRWLGDAHDRRVALLEGEAFFNVVHDAARPFRVMLDKSEIRVLGTQFDVYRKKSGDTVVTVLEGNVEVRDPGEQSSRPAWQRELHANQQIVFRPIGLIRDVHLASALNAVKWREGVLQLQDEPLPDMLDELTRYTDRRILIRDPRLAELHVGGAFSVRDVHAALVRLEKLAPVSVSEIGDTFTLDYRSH